MKNLKSFNFEELHDEEIMKIEGGRWWPAANPLGHIVAVALISHSIFHGAVNGFNEGAEKIFKAAD